MVSYEDYRKAKAKLTQMFRYEAERMANRGEFPKGVLFSVEIRKHIHPATTVTSFLRGEISEVKIIFDSEYVKSNIYNLDNPAIRDVIIHELSHVKDALMQHEIYDMVKSGKMSRREAIAKLGEGSHSRPGFRERVRKFTGSVLPSSGGLFEAGTSNYEAYYGPKYGYGIVPSDILQADLIMCGRCGFLDVVRPHDERECPKHGTTMVRIKKLTPEEVVATQTAIDRYGGYRTKEYQEYMRRKFNRYIPKSGFSDVYPQKARVKKRAAKRRLTMLDRAMRMVRR